MTLLSHHNHAANKEAVLAYQSLNQSTKVEGANPEQLIMLLFERLAEHLRMSLSALSVLSGTQNNQPPLSDEVMQNALVKKLESISKAMQIIDGLQSSLDHDKAPGLSEQLGQLYDYMNRQLLSANASNDESLVGEVLSLVSEISDAWQQMLATNNQS